MVHSQDSVLVSYCSFDVTDLAEVPHKEAQGHALLLLVMLFFLKEEGRLKNLLENLFLTSLDELDFCGVEYTPFSEMSLVFCMKCPEK